MAYTKTNWQDNTTPINDTNLNHIEQGIYDSTYLNGINVGTSQNNDYSVNILQSKNLFDKNDSIVSGEYFNESNGNIQTTTTPNNYLQEAYIKVDPNTQYIASASSNTQYIRIIEYTSSLSFIKGTSSSTSNTLSITTSSTTQYIRMSMYGSDALDTTILQKGNLILLPQIIVNDETIYYGANQNYSSVEQRIGTWIGKPLYRKIIDFGSLPNATGSSKPHGISNVDNFINQKGFCTNGISWLPIPFVSAINTFSDVQLSCDNTAIYIRTNNNMSSYNAYIILEYTKTTD